jgi:hypothetical protein
MESEPGWHESGPGTVSCPILVGSADDSTVSMSCRRPDPREKQPETFAERMGWHQQILRRKPKSPS